MRNDRPTRRQLQVMRRIRDEGLLLLAESNGECWLFDVDDYQEGKTYEEQYHPVERISDVLAWRLVLGGWVRGSGGLSPKGKEALT